ncbi:glycosyltransferase family 2 protein [Clostridium perfringens]|uniref:glycosyltransferase family 2 protein n=1 Tax=Clostridium perfringens TaxID=1502 RepID=UPI001459AF7A|nr:glycosyltransferase family 2 protein [Clostridium perfringens]NMF21132.1 glycosyltransferase family 2 protein [Clostridium perfringens]
MKLSIIIPVYNCEKYIKKCLDSIINQNFNDYEIIVIDDGSMDRSLDILTEYSKKYNFINVISWENKGQGAVRNFGVRIAKGKYITFIDSDDYLSGIDSLNSLYNQMEDKNLDLLIYNYRFVNNNILISSNLNFNDKRIYTCEEIIKKFLCTNEVEGFSCNKIFKKDILLNNNIKFLENRKFEDIPMVVNYILCCNRIMFNNDIIYNYVMRENSTTHKINLKLLLDEVYSMNLILKKIQKEMKNSEISKYINIYINKKISLYTEYRLKNLIKRRISYKEFKIILKEYLKLIKFFQCKKISLRIKILKLYIKVGSCIND